MAEDLTLDRKLLAGAARSIIKAGSHADVISGTEETHQVDSIWISMPVKAVLSMTFYRHPNLLHDESRNTNKVQQLCLR